MRKQIEALQSKYQAQHHQAQRRSTALGYLKLLLVGAALVAGYAVFWKEASRWTVPFIVLLLALAAAWIVHSRLRSRLDFYQGMARGAQGYLQRMNGGWRTFEAKGGGYAPADHPYALDLDVVGEKSLYQRLCAAGTWHGRKALAEDLLTPSYTGDEIAARQAAVRELAAMPELLCKIQYHAGKTGADPAAAQLAQHLAGQMPVLRSRLIRLCLRVFPLLFCGLLAVAAWQQLTFLYLPLLGVFTLQGVLWIIGMGSNNRYLCAVASTVHACANYAQAMEVIGQAGFTAPLLREMADALTGRDISAVNALEELDKISGRVQLKHNFIFYAAANILLLWDHQCVLSMSDWQEKYGHRLAGWLEVLGRFESLMSLAGLPLVEETVCYPAIRQGARRLTVRQLGHPLIPGVGRVSNNLSMGEDVLIISGSNMSGKTTFLRTVGINLALANAGGPVCAAQMECGLFALASSMRIADNLDEGISTFYAELGKIKAIIEQARVRDDLFFLIDEIFRGTNSEDRLYGAGQVIGELAGRRAMGLITTHDLSLCAMEGDYPNIQNYSFSEQYPGGQMTFDYRLKKGKSRTTNARYLMEQVGILKGDSSRGED